MKTFYEKFMAFLLIFESLHKQKRKAVPRWVLLIGGFFTFLFWSLYQFFFNFFINLEIRRLIHLNKDVLKRFEGKNLGQQYYGKRICFTVKDFLNPHRLHFFLCEVLDHESSFTREGLKFLSEFYGFDDLAKIFLKLDPDYPFKTVKDYVQYFKNYEKE